MQFPPFAEGKLLGGENKDGLSIFKCVCRKELICLPISPTRKSQQKERACFEKYMKTYRFTRKFILGRKTNIRINCFPPDACRDLLHEPD